MSLDPAHVFCLSSIKIINVKISVNDFFFYYQFLYSTLGKMVEIVKKLNYFVVSSILI